MFAATSPEVEHSVVQTAATLKKAHTGQSGVHVCQKITAHSLKDCPTGNKNGHKGEEDSDRKKRKLSMIEKTCMYFISISGHL